MKCIKCGKASLYGKCPYCGFDAKQKTFRAFAQLKEKDILTILQQKSTHDDDKKGAPAHKSPSGEQKNCRRAKSRFYRESKSQWAWYDTSEKWWYFASILLPILFSIFLLLNYSRFQTPPILAPIIDSLPFAIGWGVFVYGYPIFRWLRFDNGIFTYSLGWITWCITGLVVLLFIIAGLLAMIGVEASVLMDIFIAVCILWALVDLITYLFRIEYD